MLFQHSLLQPGSFEMCWRKFTEAIIETQIPYAYILGNHDAEGELNRYQISKLDETNPFSVRRDCDGPAGKLDFVIPLYSSKNETKLAANIWLFDTGDRSCDGFDDASWGCVEQSTINWYDKKSKEIKEEHGDHLHNIAFIHIPLPEYVDLANTQRIYGVSDDDIGCPYVNNGFFNSILKNKDITAIFAGHDHENNFGGYYQGIELVYGQKSGYAAYGQERGARVITLKEEYDPEGELFKVSRNHFVMFENGTLGLNEPLKRREGKDSKFCVYVGYYGFFGPFKKFWWNIKKFFGNLV